MLTPQEVAEHSFAKASFGGYNMTMVDEFLDQVTNDYTVLFKENATLKAKMKGLADKVEEYRSTEEAMRKTLLTAQQMADQMVVDAEAEKATIVSEAQKAAEGQLASIRREVESEELRLTAAQNATAAYISKLKELYEREIEYISSLSRLSAPQKQPDMVAQTADAIGSAVEKAVEETISAPVEEKKEPPVEPLEVNALYQELKRGVIHGGRTGEAADSEEAASSIDIPAPVHAIGLAEDEEEEEDEATTRRIDFKNLKFGKDYQI